MNKWMYASIFAIVILAATGCSKQEAEPAAISPTPAAVAVASSPTPTPAPAATVTPATPTPVATATVAPAASTNPTPSASAAPQQQTTATPAPTATPAVATPTPKPTPAPVATPSPSPTAKPQATVSAADSSEKAQLLYKSNCLSCHGAGLTGDYGPNLTKVGARRTKEQITAQIMNGKIEMPPFKDTLKADEVEALANWLSGMK